MTPKLRIDSSELLKRIQTKKTLGLLHLQETEGGSLPRAKALKNRSVRVVSGHVQLHMIHQLQGPPLEAFQQACEEDVKSIRSLLVHRPLPNIYVSTEKRLGLQRPVKNLSNIIFYLTLSM